MRTLIAAYGTLLVAAGCTLSACGESPDKRPETAEHIPPVPVGHYAKLKYGTIVYMVEVDGGVCAVVQSSSLDVEVSCDWVSAQKPRVEAALPLLGVKF